MQEGDWGQLWDGMGIQSPRKKKINIMLYRVVISKRPEGPKDSDVISAHILSSFTPMYFKNPNKLLSSSKSLSVIKFSVISVVCLTFVKFKPQ